MPGNRQAADQDRVIRAPAPSFSERQPSRPEPSQRRKSSSERPADPRETEQPARPLPREIGGQKGPEPTRYGDWEKAGRCTDF
ncbi:MAG: DUF1674 domain-containing protein [Geminicoccales bacterium]